MFNNCSNCLGSGRVSASEELPLADELKSRKNWSFSNLSGKLNFFEIDYAACSKFTLFSDKLEFVGAAWADSTDLGVYFDAELYVVGHASPLL